MIPAIVVCSIAAVVIWVAFQCAYWHDFYRPVGLRFNWRTALSHRWYIRWCCVQVAARLMEERHG